MPSALLSLETPVVIAHRGGAGLRPENTMAAFEHAAALGVDALECDVHLSKDGQPVIIHDEMLDRTTSATGPVEARTAAELAAIDAGCRFRDEAGGRPFADRGVGVPRLADLLERFPGLPVVVEIKGHNQALVPAVLEVIGRHGGQRPVIVGGFSDSVLATVRAAAPGIATSASSSEVKRAVWRAWFGLSPPVDGCRLFQVPIRYGVRRVLTPRLVRAARRVGLPVHAWVIDDPAQMRLLLAWGVTGLITDRPDLARAVVDEVSPAAAGVAE